MSFEKFCVLVVTTIILLGVTGGLGMLTTIYSKDNEEWVYVGWVFSTIGFALYLTSSFYSQ